MTKKELIVEFILVALVIVVCAWIYASMKDEPVTTVTAVESDSIAVKVVENDTLKVDTVIVADTLKVKKNDFA